MLREAFATPEFRRALLPVIGVEMFNAGLSSHEHAPVTSLPAAQLR
jgi:hypothetical protein